MFVLDPSSPRLSREQQEFLAAGASLGATSASGARPLIEFPRLSTEELNHLVQLGLVREAAAWTYYTFAPKLSALTQIVGRDVFDQVRVKPMHQYLKRLSFWILVFLIPLALLQWSSRR